VNLNTLLMSQPKEPESGIVNVFISYHRHDDVIAKALKKELTEVNPVRVRCFLDSEEIAAGAKWEPILLESLKKADWLVCIFTGEQSAYCGYEAGIFSDAKGLSVVHNEDSRIVCLHDMTPIPEFLHAHQNYFITFPPDRPLKGYNEDQFYSTTPVYRFLAFFYAYKGLRPPPNNAIEADAQRRSILDDAKAITAAFKEGRFSDVKGENFVPPRIEITIADGGGEDGANFNGFPDDAEVSADDKTFDLFNVNLLKPIDGSYPLASWKLVRAAQVACRMSTSWMDEIERNAIEAAKSRGTANSQSEITFKRDAKIFRPILARHRFYYDGKRTFSVLFIETLPRQFLGNRNTSLLLAGIVLGSRFRFAYLEGPNKPYQRLFNDNLEDREFAINCRQLRYDIDRIEHESAEFGLLDRDEFVKAFGPENMAIAEGFTEKWDELKEDLFGALPIREIEKSERPAVQSAIEKFFAEVERENAAFLEKAIEVYQMEMSTQLKPILRPLKGVE
jgi:hypothetical protein